MLVLMISYTLRKIKIIQMRVNNYFRKKYLTVKTRKKQRQ